MSIIVDELIKEMFKGISDIDESYLSNSFNTLDIIDIINDDELSDAEKIDAETILTGCQKDPSAMSAHCAKEKIPLQNQALFS